MCFNSKIVNNSKHVFIGNSILELQIIYSKQLGLFFLSFDDLFSYVIKHFNSNIKKTYILMCERFLKNVSFSM